MPKMDYRDFYRMNFFILEASPNERIGQLLERISAQNKKCKDPLTRLL